MRKIEIVCLVVACCLFTVPITLLVAHNFVLPVRPSSANEDWTWQLMFAMSRAGEINTWIGVAGTCVGFLFLIPVIARGGKGEDEEDGTVSFTTQGAREDNEWLQGKQEEGWLIKSVIPNSNGKSCKVVLAQEAQEA